jgi:hypothetical protein
MNGIEIQREIYRTALTGYLKWTDKLKRSYGWKPGEQFDQISLSNRDYDLCIQGTTKLRAMEEILGLTEKEINDVEQQILKEINS